MPSIDDGLLLQLYDSGKLLIFAEQNNGYIWQNFLKVLYRHRKASADLARVATINTLDAEGRPRFIHSGTYEELMEAFGLTAAQIAESIEKTGEPMSVPVLHEGEVEELDLPGRRFRWLVADGRIPSDQCSACVIRVTARRSGAARAQPSSQRGSDLYHERIGPRAGGRRSCAGSRGIDGSVSSRRGTHAAQHQQRRDEGRVLFCAGDDAGQLQNSRRRGLSRLTALRSAVERRARGSKEYVTSKKILISTIAAVSGLLSAIFAATHDFIPDFAFRGSSLAGWHTLGHANWRAENGEITGKPETPDGGWLVLDKGYQDVKFYTEFRCAGNCDAGVLLRTEKTSDGGWKGVYVSLSGDGGSYDLTLNAEGKELNRTRLLQSDRAVRANGRGSLGQRER